ncbi:protein RRP5 homolog isoform X3 [Rhincodon typus]|nr:protein RRP5 homolog isoform X3 [Rhincodon typus]XP_048464837.1 protein RRP5 homolog isoform X3 [Rhincodon typus]
MAAMDEDFPRGGVQRKPTREKVKRSKEDENLFGVHHDDVRKKQKRKRAELIPVKAKKQKTKNGGTLQTKQKIKAQILSFKKLNVGMLLLGCVKEVTDFELVVGLPHGLTGYVSLTNICDAYTKSLREQIDEELSEDLVALSDLYSPGMVVRCAVYELGKTKANRHSLKLSINPKDVNKALSPGALQAGMLLSGCVSSVEEHGYLVDIGVKATKAFLSHTKTQEYVKNKNQGMPLRVGQYLTTLVESVKNDGRIAQLSIRHIDVAAATATEDQKWSLSNLLPGLVIRAEIQKVACHGLILQFLSGFTGSVDFMHMDPRKVKTCHPGQKVKACILYVQPETKAVHLTLRPAFLQPGAVLQQPSPHGIGKVLEHCTVRCYHKEAGVIFQLADGTFAYSRKVHLSGTKTPLNPNDFREGTKHRCRVIDHSPMEQMVLVSLKKSVLDAPFLKYQDIKPGQLVEGKITSLENYGMNVKLTHHIRGLVPRAHLSDIPLKHPEKLYSVGNLVKCRVLMVNSDTKKLTLTLKKTLVGSKLSVITQYKEAVPKRLAHGYVVSVKPFGCIVRFYGDVRGLVPQQELSTHPILFPEKVFYVGQVVKVAVLKCDPTQEKLLLSLKATQNVGTEADGFTKEIEESSMYPTGKIVDVEVLAKVENGLKVSILPQHVPAFLPTMHLSDHVSNCRLLAARLQKGDVLSNVMCLSQTNGQIILSRKAAVIAFAEQGPMPKDVLELQVGTQMPGFVKNIMAYGVFVKFPHGLVGLAPKAAMSDKFVTNTEDHFVVGQTVVAKVTNLDEEKKRVLLTLKVSECGSAEGAGESLALLSQYCAELEFVRTLMSSRDSPVVTSLSCLAIGQRLQLVVDRVEDDGTVYFTGTQVTKLTVTASRYHQREVTVSPGQRCTAVVLFVDLLSSVVHVSLRQELLNANARKLKRISQHLAVVQLVTQDVAVVSLAGTSKLLLVPVTFHLNDTFHFDSEKLSVGQTISLSLQTAGIEHHGIPLAARGHRKHSRAKRERQMSEGEEDLIPTVQHALCIGDVISGTVKSVQANCLLIKLEGGVTGFVHASEILDQVPNGSFPSSKQKVGNVVTAKVIGGREVKSHKFLPITHPNFSATMPELTLRPSKLSGDCEVMYQSEQLADQLKSYKPGQVLTCYVSKYNCTKKCLDVEVTPIIQGSVELLLMSQRVKHLKYPKKHFQSGQALTATVIAPDRTNTRLSLSLTGACSLDEGSITLGTIEKVTPHLGVTIRLPFGKTGQVGLCDIADSYKESPLEELTLGRMVRCCVISKNEHELAVSLRSSRVYPERESSINDPEITTAKDLRKGQLLRGYIKAVGEPGVFVSLCASLSGRVLFNYVTDYYVKDHGIFLASIPKGKLVTVKVLSINNGQGEVELSLLPQDTGAPDVLSKSLGLPSKQSKMLNDAKGSVLKTSKRKRRGSESEQVSSKKLKIKKKQKHSEEADSGVEVYCHEEDSDAEFEGSNTGLSPVSQQQPKPRKTQVPRLEVSRSFAWDVSLNTISPVTGKHEDISSDSEDDEPEDSKAKLTRREKEVGKRQMEKELMKAEQQLMDPNRHPQSADDFDRLVLSSPNSSILWTQYMAFHLHTTEIEKARTVAERALKTISFREEQEKLNVWVALLNLENLYGTEESLMKVFERAVQYSEPLKVFQQLASIYTKSEKYKQADNLYNTMLKRFRQESTVWLSYATFLLKQGKTDSTNALLQRALKCLPQKEHVDIIAKFAQLEFRLGDTERAKAMFESTLSNYPKRTDLWSVYIDMMVKHGSQDEVRHLFERVIHLKLAPKKMKFFFKRYLEYEKKHGSEERVQAVKEKALEYVESTSLSVDS